MRSCYLSELVRQDFGTLRKDSTDPWDLYLIVIKGLTQEEGIRTH